MTPRYPHIRVQLSDEDGNAMAIISRVRRALKDDGVSSAEQKEFSDAAMSGDYDNVLRTAMAWVDWA